MTAPRLVIVTGAPGTGKTTLARHLARALDLAVLTKDDLKESLADRLGAGDRQRSRELGRTAYAELYAGARDVLAGGRGVVIEANFHRGRSEPHLLELCALSRPVVIECRCEAALRRRRFEERGARGERHAVHLDSEILANEWHDDLSINEIDVGAPRLVVDTTTGYTPALPHIESFARGEP